MLIGDPGSMLVLRHLDYGETPERRRREPCHHSVHNEDCAACRRRKEPS